MNLPEEPAAVAPRPANFPPARRRVAWLGLRRLRKAALGASLAFVALSSALPARDRPVAIRATADPDYVAQRQSVTGATPVQRYVFLQGQAINGALRDQSLESAEIGSITRALAPYLAHQHFLPTSTPADADIVIAVHWGSTTALRHNQENLDLLMGQARDQQYAAREFYEGTYGARYDAPDMAAGLLAEAAQRAASAPDYSWLDAVGGRTEHVVSEMPTASILGIADLLHRDARHAFSREDIRLAESMVDEERYFVVLAAYDLKSKADGSPARRLWVARLSMRAAGTNFPEALEQLGAAGAEYFGTHQPGIKIDRRPNRKRTPKVEIGDATVVEETE